MKDNRCLRAININYSISIHSDSFFNVLWISFMHMNIYGRGTIKNESMKKILQNYEKISHFIFKKSIINKDLKKVALLKSIKSKIFLHNHSLKNLMNSFFMDKFGFHFLIFLYIISWLKFGNFGSFHDSFLTHSHNILRI